MRQSMFSQQEQALMRESFLELQQSRDHSVPGLHPRIEPDFDPNTCRSVYVGNIHKLVTETLLKEFFAIISPVEACQLIRKERSSYGFIHYFDPRAASLAICYLKGKELFGQPMQVDWANPNCQREDTSGLYNIFVGNLGDEVTDTMLFACFSAYRSCLYARVMWHQNTCRSRGFGFVSFWNKQDAQSAINDLSGKWLGSRQIWCNWATKGAGAHQDKHSLDGKSVVEFLNGSSEYGKERLNSEAPENDPRYTTVYVGNLGPEVTQKDLYLHFHALGAGVIDDVIVHRDKGFGFVRYNTHSEAALAILQMGNNRSILSGRQIKCSWGRKPTPTGTTSNPVPLPTAASASDSRPSDSDLLAFDRWLLTSQMGGANSINQPQEQRNQKQAAMALAAARAGKAISDGEFLDGTDNQHSN